MTKTNISMERGEIRCLRCYSQACKDSEWSEESSTIYNTEIPNEFDIVPVSTDKNKSFYKFQWSTSAEKERRRIDVDEEILFTQTRGKPRERATAAYVGIVSVLYGYLIVVSAQENPRVNGVAMKYETKITPRTRRKRLASGWGSIFVDVLTNG